MKYSIFILLTTILLYSCKKQEAASTETANTNTGSSVPQDSKLLGVWAQDSSKADGAATSFPSTGSEDSLFISGTYKEFYGTFYGSVVKSWQTKKDSLILTDQGSSKIFARFSYSITGKNLHYYLKQSSPDPNYQFWFHKVK